MIIRLYSYLLYCVKIVCIYCMYSIPLYIIILILFYYIVIIEVLNNIYFAFKLRVNQMYFVGLVLWHFGLDS